MSNAIRYDTLLVRELARELDERLRGAWLDAVYFDRPRLRVTLQTRAASRDLPRTPALLWRLHPGAGHLAQAPPRSGAGRLPLPSRRIAGVHAPADERLLEFRLEAGDDDAPGAPDRIVIELQTNQWNAIAVAPDGRIAAVLRERDTRGRALRPGYAYTYPEPSARAGADVPLTLEDWQELLGPMPPEERLRALPRRVAYASPQNAAAILGDAGVRDDPAALERAFHRYRASVWADRLHPGVHRDGEGWQPYLAPEPVPDGTPSLLEAFEAAATHAALEPAAPAATEEALALVAERIDLVDKRLRRLRQEQEGATEAAVRLRAQADVVLSNLHRIPRGAPAVELPDFAGVPIRIDLDPALGGAENAQRLYEAARRRDRAAKRLPALVDAAAAERVRLEELAGRVRDGTASPDELARLRAVQRAQAEEGPALPYRTYRTTGGLEVRVGRGSRANDALTFRHSHPNDIWLHARDVAGAHVVLRWGRADANPSARDIAEAAVLAALHSRARSSGSVPVDWTRRKYVRKPRKAGPGLVLPERVRTVFVEPDPAVEERLRVDAGLA